MLVSEKTNARDIIARVRQEDGAAERAPRRSSIRTTAAGATREAPQSAQRGRRGQNVPPRDAGVRERRQEIPRQAVPEDQRRGGGSTQVLPSQQPARKPAPPKRHPDASRQDNPGRRPAADPRPQRDDIRPYPKRKSTGAKVVDGLLDLLIDVGTLLLVVLASFALHMYVIMPYTGARQENQSINALHDQWGGDTPAPDSARPADPIPRPATHEVFATMRIPALDTPDAPWEYTITAGASIEDLRTGVGWYNEYFVEDADGNTSTIPAQMPGEPGNFATAAHRDGSTAPYQEINNLQVCDTVIVDTAGGSYTYKILPLDPNDQEQVNKWNDCATGLAKNYKPNLYGNVPGLEIVSPYDVEVINPIPGRSDLQMQDWAVPMITLTSCHPRNSNAQRIILHGVLDSSAARS